MTSASLDPSEPELNRICWCLDREAKCSWETQIQENLLAPPVMRRTDFGVCCKPACPQLPDPPVEAQICFSPSASEQRDDVSAGR